MGYDDTICYGWNGMGVRNSLRDEIFRVLAWSLGRGNNESFIFEFESGDHDYD